MRQDETIQSVLGMNQKHILFPCPGIFQPLLCPKIFPSYLTPPPPLYLPPLPTSFTSFPAHSISNAWESFQAWVAQSFKETWDTRFEEGGDFNIERMLLPSPFFFGVVQVKKATTTCCHCLLGCVRKEEDNDNVSSSSSMVLLEQRRQRQQVVIAFFSMSKKKKKMACQHVVVFFYGVVLTKKMMVVCCHCLLLWCVKI